MIGHVCLCRRRSVRFFFGEFQRFVQSVPLRIMAGMHPTQSECANHSYLCHKTRSTDWAGYFRSTHRRVHRIVGKESSSAQPEWRRARGSTRIKFTFFHLMLSDDYGLLGVKAQNLVPWRSVCSSLYDCWRWNFVTSQGLGNVLAHSHFAHCIVIFIRDLTFVCREEQAFLQQL